jgi:hypothetical protein
MGEKLVIGPIDKGLKNDRTAFVIDNDSFPLLKNAYQWRGRVKRKRGTQQLGRLRRYIGTTDGSGNITVTISPHPITSGISSFVIGTDVFYDPGGASPVTLITNGAAGTHTLNRSTGVLTIAGSIINTAVIYYPGLPVMGLEDLTVTDSQFPGTLAFDTKYSYNISTDTPYSITDVSFFYNPATGTPGYTNYTQKGSSLALNWNGKTYQQFWTTNYQGAFWATNGINVPFSSTNIGMQFIAASKITSATQTSATTVDFVIPADSTVNIIIGDFVFANEFTGTSGNTLNWQTGYVTNKVGTTYTITFPNASIGAAGLTPGILQTLTNYSDLTKDVIRFYLGNPNDGLIPPTFNHTGGWVNFMPPLSQSVFGIADEPQAVYYLVGARMIIPFKDRLIFLGAVVQTSTGSPIYLQDTVVYTQNGTPYYTVSFQGFPTNPTNLLPILIPPNQTASPAAFFDDSTGFGGYITAGLDQPIVTAADNEDVLILGFDPDYQVRFVYTGNDIVPFNFYVINSELGSSSTFSSISMDRTVISRGPRSFTMSSQVEVQRFDLDIPDQVFQISLQNNGNERFCAQRDFINEWIYFTFNSVTDRDYQKYIYPSQSLQYNYRDNSWAIFNETYTTYGSFRRASGLTWATVGNTYPTWEDWTENWEAGESTLYQPQVIAGNQQGFVIFRAEGLGEGASLSIQNISSNTITSPDHGLLQGDYITFTGVLGDLGYYMNGLIFSVTNITQNTFDINPSSLPAISYVGGGQIIRYYVPVIMTKQFPVSWNMARKTRLGVQQYLLTATDISQITLKIFLSQDSSNAWNFSTIVPDINSSNDGLEFSTILYTCPESTNLGLSPANINLLQLNSLGQNNTSSNAQAQIWHRINTSLIGDTVQLGFTLSDEQMRSYSAVGTSTTITAATQASFCILSCVNTTLGSNIQAGNLVTVTGVNGMYQLNNNTYVVVSATTSSVTIGVNSTSFNTYVSGGSVQVVAPIFQTDEIELHSIILDVSPSQVLA